MKVRIESTRTPEEWRIRHMVSKATIMATLSKRMFTSVRLYGRDSEETYDEKQRHAQRLKKCNDKAQAAYIKAYNKAYGYDGKKGTRLFIFNVSIYRR